jgi:hypothetical protein
VGTVLVGAGGAVDTPGGPPGAGNEPVLPPSPHAASAITLDKPDKKASLVTAEAPDIALPPGDAARARSLRHADQTAAHARLSTGIQRHKARILRS